MFIIVSWPDPLLQERIEDMGFFFDTQAKGWIRFCEEAEAQTLADWLKRHQLAADVRPARGQGELKKHPKLSDRLVLPTGGDPTTCGLCGSKGVFCRKWVEGDDTDTIDYPNPAKFFLCGECVQTQLQPHPRLYAVAEDQL